MCINTRTVSCQLTADAALLHQVVHVVHHCAGGGRQQHRAGVTAQAVLLLRVLGHHCAQAALQLLLGPDQATAATLPVLVTLAVDGLLAQALG